MSRPSLPALLLVVALALAALLWTAAAGSEPAPQEAALNPDGAAYEIHPSPGGPLWISDYRAGEIWAVDPATDVYTIYGQMGGTSDARPAGDGTVWWVDQAHDRLGHLTPTSGEATLWHIPVATTLFGTAIDGAGQVWVTESSRPHLFRLSVTAAELCTYTIAASGGSDYLLAQGSQIWLGDRANDRIRRLDSDSGTLTSWLLPGNAQPEGLAFGPEGRLWWADPHLRYLGRLEPDLDRLTTFPLPYGSEPEMIATSGNRLWYTWDQGYTVGRMDPWLVKGTPQAVLTTTVTLSPTCATVSPAATATLPITTGVVTWTEVSYNRSSDTPGVLTYELPDDAFPWGIAAAGGEMWIVDTGRQLLVRVADQPSVSACKLADGDGVLTTTVDQAPVEGWTVYLSVDGVRQEPGQLTHATGCYTWDDLETGLAYGVEEDLAAGWTPLTPTSYDFGEISAVGGYGYSFVNANNAAVTACKLADGDGVLTTTVDQAPVEGWSVYLLADGVRREPGQATGVDGCTTWTDLVPAHRYGVEEGAAVGWSPLVTTSHNFGTLAAGQIVSHTFVNAESATVAACKLADADGTLTTTIDQTPVPGWTVYLLADGERQGSGRQTGADGCTTWTGLAPAHIYGAEEAVKPGWQALTPISDTFELAPPGAAYAAEFINSGGSYVVYLPLITRLIVR